MIRVFHEFGKQLSASLFSKIISSHFLQDFLLEVQADQCQTTLLFERSYRFLHFPSSYVSGTLSHFFDLRANVLFLQLCPVCPLAIKFSMVLLFHIQKLNFTIFFLVLYLLYSKFSLQQT